LAAISGTLKIVANKLAPLIIKNTTQLEAQKHEAHYYGDIVSKYMHKKAKSFVFQWKVASEIKAIKKRFSAIVRQRIELGAIIANNLPGGCLVHHMNQQLSVGIYI
jgi:hypothetical protein